MNHSLMDVKVLQTDDIREVPSELERQADIVIVNGRIIKNRHGHVTGQR